MDVDHSYRTPLPGLYQSQHGEDLWLDEYFSQKSGGYFVEVGAYDGVVLSNTFFFEKARGWSGILVEPDAENAANCRKQRPNAKTFQCAASSPGNDFVRFTKVEGGGVYSTSSLNANHEQRLVQYGLEYTTMVVPAKTLDRILVDAGAEINRIDFISIDVEEAEMEVLGGLSLAHWKPKIVVIESNQTVRRPEIRDYFLRYGYVYVRSIAINDLYAPAPFGKAFANAVDYLRYGWAKRDRRTSTMSAIQRFFERHLLWRFKL